MGDIIRCKIDVLKIDKARLFAGAKGKYLDITLLPTKDPSGVDKFGNTHMVIQDVSKEEREQGVKGAILGNAKTVTRQPSQPTPQEHGRAPSSPLPAQPADNLDMSDTGDEPF